MIALPLLFMVLALVAMWSDWREPVGALAAGLFVLWLWLERGELASYGFQLANWPMALLRYGILGLVVVSAGLLLVGERPHGELHFSLKNALWLGAWGSFQQALMLGFLAPSLEDLVGWPVGPILAALFFASMHLPNPYLTKLTLVAGLGAVWVWHFTPNVWIAGSMHALGTILIQSYTDDEDTGWWAVGPNYLEKIR